MPEHDPVELGDDWCTTSPAEQPVHEGRAPGDGTDTSYLYDSEPPPPDEWDGYDGYDGYDSEPRDPDHGELQEQVSLPAGTTSPSGGGRSGRVSKHGLAPDDPDLIRHVLRRSLASVNGRSVTEVTALAGRILSSADLLADLDDKVRSGWEALLDAVNFECSILKGVAAFDLSTMVGGWFLKGLASSEREAVLDVIEGGDLPASPYVELEALIEAHQAVQSKRGALKLIRAVDSGAPSSEKMRAFRNIPAPTRIKEVQNNTWVRTAKEWFEHDAASTGSAAGMIFSSGYPTMDLACAGTGDEPGLIRPGEFWIGAAGTGHGKSAMTRRLITAMTEDLTSEQGWAHPHGRTIVAFTEEEATDVARAAMLGPDQPFSHLSDNISLAKVGESRQRLIMPLYDAVAAAERWSQETGSPASERFPYLYFLDYIQAIKEPGEGADTEAIARTADLLMRGVAAWDHEMMASISGLDFQAYAGMKWPEGYEDHRVAVFVLSQLRKEGTNVYYREGKSSVSDFVVMDANGQPCWTPQENDYAIPDRSDLRGSGVLLNHATGLVFFHRSQPTASVVRDSEGKVVGLSDTRARFIVAKARKSVSMPYIPVRFDSNPEGFRGMFYDDAGFKHCVVEQRTELQDCFLREGDPMLPVRPKRSPFRGVAY